MSSVLKVASDSESLTRNLEGPHSFSRAIRALPLDCRFERLDLDRESCEDCVCAHADDQIRLHGTRIGEVDLASDPRNWLPPRMSAFASTSTSTSTATATATGGSRQDLDDACDACLLACSTCSPQPVDSCCPLPLPFPPLSQPPLSPCSQLFQDCQACASQGQGGGEVAASHLAFCCDDEGCLPHGGDGRDKGKRVERDYQAPWDHTWLDDCAQCVGDHHRAPPPSQPPLGAIALEPHHDVTANGLGLVDDASCCSTPWLDHSDAAMFEDCRNAGCFDLPPESSHASTSSIDSLSTLATSIEGPLQGNEAHSVDLDGLLTGLDNSTIQDIVRVFPRPALVLGCSSATDRLLSWYQSSTAVAATRRAMNSLARLIPRRMRIISVCLNTSTATSTIRRDCRISRVTACLTRRDWVTRRITRRLILPRTAHATKRDRLCSTCADGRGAT